MKNEIFRLAIIDDQQIFASSFKALLLTFDFVEEVVVLPPPNSEKFCLEFEDYALYIIDINMPRFNGFEVSKIIKNKNRAQKIALLSSRADQLSVSRARELQIEGYLFKSISEDKLEVALKHILSGEEYYQKKTKKDQKIFTFQDGTKIVLTKRELEFLELLLLELTSKEIAHRMSITEHTVISYRKGLFLKFNVLNMVGLAKYAMEIF